MNDIGEGNEAESSHVISVESAVIGCRILHIRMYRVHRESGMIWQGGIDAMGCACDSHGRRLMGGVRDDLHVVGIQMVVC